MILWIALSVFSQPVSGSLAAWGNSDYGQTDVPMVSNVIAISAGAYHSLALLSDNSVIAWGQDLFGQCDVPEFLTASAISAGVNHSVAIKTDGSLIQWGNIAPGNVCPAGDYYIAVSAGDNYNFALRADGTIDGWGSNTGPVIYFPGGSDYVAVSTGYNHALALRADGAVLAWGDNSYGQCDVPQGLYCTAIAAGETHNLGITPDGSVIAWGANWFGQCNAPAGNDFVAIAAGQTSSLALRSDGSLVGWGFDEDNVYIPPVGNNYISLSYTRDHAVAIMQSAGLVSGMAALNFNNVYLNVSVNLDLILSATGDLPVTINNIYTYHNNSIFQTNQTQFPICLNPGDSLNINVTFNPVSALVYTDTLYISNDSSNFPLLKINLSGTGVYVTPSVPQNLVVTNTGTDMNLTWDAVTTTVLGTPVTPDYYIVLYNETESEDMENYYFLWATPLTGFTHPLVALFRDSMFYKVLAYKSNDRSSLERLIGLNGTEQKIRYKDLLLD